MVVVLDLIAEASVEGELLGGFVNDNCLRNEIDFDIVCCDVGSCSCKGSRSFYECEVFGACGADWFCVRSF